MPMIDVYAAAGTFADTHGLAMNLATAVMTIEQAAQRGRGERPGDDRAGLTPA